MRDSSISHHNDIRTPAIITLIGRHDLNITHVGKLSCCNAYNDVAAPTIDASPRPAREESGALIYRKVTLGRHGTVLMLGNVQSKFQESQQREAQVFCEDNEAAELKLLIAEQ